MRPRFSRIARRTTVGLAAALLLLGGCGAPNSGPADAPLPANGMPAVPAPQEPVPTEAPNEDTNTDRKIARTASISLVVDDIQVAANELNSIASSLQGAITKESLSLPDEQGYVSGSSSVEVTVASANLDEALKRIGALGRVLSRQIESTDVTSQVVDVDSRVKTMRASIARLQALMNQAGTVTQIADVESELTQREGELEALLASQANLSQRVATAPISVHLRTESQAPAPGASGFLSGLGAGWDSLVGAGQVALTVLGALLPWLAFAAIILVPSVALYRRRRRNRPPQEPQPRPAPTPAPAPAAWGMPVWGVPQGMPPQGAPTQAAPPPDGQPQGPRPEGPPPAATPQPAPPGPPDGADAPAETKASTPSEPAPAEPADAPRKAGRGRAGTKPGTRPS